MPAAIAHPTIIREQLIRPVLSQMNMYSEAAEVLLLGTAAHESMGFTKVDQWTGGVDTTLGPAMGLYQIEQRTHRDLFKSWLKYRRPRQQQLEAFAVPGLGPEQQLAFNMAYSTAVARMLYFRVPAALPAADDLPGLAAYWKQYWNTEYGAGTPQKWLNGWQRHVVDAGD